MHPDIQNKACLELTFLCEKGTCHTISGVNREKNVLVSNRWHSAFFQDQEKNRIFPKEFGAIGINLRTGVEFPV